MLSCLYDKFWIISSSSVFIWLWNLVWQPYRFKEQWSNITLKEEEEGGLVLKDEENLNIKSEIWWCLVGCFLTDRDINIATMKSTLASMWRPIKGVYVQDLAPNLFLFQFFHEMDLQCVMKNGPWNSNNHLLLMKRLEKGEQPTRMKLTDVDFWV